MNINRVLLTGNLTRDPELRTTPGGASVCEISIAINSREKRQDEWQDRVDYFDVICWGTTAENVARHMAKGRPVAVGGRLRLERWETPDGEPRRRIVVVAQAVQFLSTGKRSDDRGGDFEPPSDYGGSADTGSYDDAAEPSAYEGAAGPEPQPAAAASDDDIPF